MSFVPSGGSSIRVRADGTRAASKGDSSSATCAASGPTRSPSTRSPGSSSRRSARLPRAAAATRRSNCSSSSRSWASPTSCRRSDDFSRADRSNALNTVDPEVNAMSQVMLLVGTRKGCFVLESDGDRRDWNVRGPFCEGWPVYHAIYDHGRRARSTPPPRASGTAPASGAAPTSARPGRRRARASAIPTTATSSCRRCRRCRRRTAGCSPARRWPGIFESRDGGATWKLLSTLEHPASNDWNDPAKQPPGPPRCLGDHSAPGRRAGALLGHRPGLQPLRDDRRRRDLDAAQQRAPRRLAARVRRHRLLRPQARDRADRPQPHVPAEPLRHAPERRRRAVVDGDHGGAAERLRLRRCGASARQGHVLRRPGRPGARADDAGRQGVGLAHARRGLVLAAAPRGPAAGGRVPRRPARGDGDRLARLAGPLLRHEHRPGVREHRRGRDAGARSRATCRRSRRSRWR